MVRSKSHAAGRCLATAMEIREHSEGTKCQDWDLARSDTATSSRTGSQPHLAGGNQRGTNRRSVRQRNSAQNTSCLVQTLSRVSIMWRDLIRFLPRLAFLARGFTIPESLGWSPTSVAQREVGEANPLKDYFLRQTEGPGVWKWMHYRRLSRAFQEIYWLRGPRRRGWYL